MSDASARRIIAKLPMRGNMTVLFWPMVRCGGKCRVAHADMRKAPPYFSQWESLRNYPSECPSVHRNREGWK